MQTPNKIGRQEFIDQRNTYYAESCTWNERRYIHLCRKCEMPIQFVNAYVSLHYSPFQDVCAGEGKVIQAPIPYCPKCEKPPADSGCLHPDSAQAISA